MYYRESSTMRYPVLKAECVELKDNWIIVYENLYHIWRTEEDHQIPGT